MLLLTEEDKRNLLQGGSSWRAVLANEACKKKRLLIGFLTRNVYRVVLKSANVSLVYPMRPQLLFLLSVSWLFTVQHSLAPRSPNRRASLHRRCALTSLLRARTGLGLCLSHRLTVVCSVEAQRAVIGQYFYSSVSMWRGSDPTLTWK